jgi:hypothetical protein
MEIERDNWRAVLHNGATGTGGVHSAAHPMNIDLLWAMKFYHLQRTSVVFQSDVFRAILAGIKIYLV